MKSALGTSPWRMSPQIRKFVRNLGLQDAPDFLPVISFESLMKRKLDIDSALLLPHLPDMLAKSHGGEALTGWRILHVPGILLEAMPYKAWISKDGQLIHPVWEPVQAPFLWVRDDKALEVYAAKGPQIHIYRPSKEMKKIIGAWTDFLRSMDPELVELPEDMSISGLARVTLFIRSMMTRNFADVAPQPRDRCPCGSKSKFGKCCEPDFLDFYDAQLEFSEEMLSQVPDCHSPDAEMDGILEELINPVEQANPTLVNQRLITPNRNLNLNL